MSIQMSERHPSADTERIMTPDEVKAVLTYTCYDALNDVYKADAEEALAIVNEIGAGYEKILAEYHKNCNMLVDTRSSKLCHDIIEYLSGIGAEVECTADATKTVFGVSVDAYFSQAVSFAGKLDEFRSLLENSELRASVPYNGNKVRLSFYIQLGRYVPKETE